LSTDCANPARALQTCDLDQKVGVERYHLILFTAAMDTVPDEALPDQALMACDIRSWHGALRAAAYRTELVELSSSDVSFIMEQALNADDLPQAVRVCSIGAVVWELGRLMRAGSLHADVMNVKHPFAPEYHGAVDIWLACHGRWPQMTE
jgi:hypothetical protein